MSLYKDRVIGSKKHIEVAIALLLRIIFYDKTGQIDFHIIK